MSTTLDKHLAEVREQLEVLTEEKEKLFQEKSDFSIKAVGLLCKELKEGIDHLFEALSDSEIFDKSVRGDLHNTIMDSINSFAQAKHEINFTPTINIDLTPLKAAITGATDQNKVLQGLIEKLSNGTGKQEELSRLIMLIGERQIAAFDKINSMADMRPELSAINETLSKPKPTDFEIKVTKRDENRGFFETATIKAINDGR